MDFSTYEFRCSALGKVISKTGALTDGVKTYLTDLFIGEVEGVKKEFTCKQFEKGTWCEEDGFTLLNTALYPRQLVLKNKERKRNGWIHGEWDTIMQQIVYDIKNAYDRFTFGKAALTWDYEWQLRGYMWLLNLLKARLFYCLNNTPEHLLIDEERKLFYRHNFVTFENEEYIKLCQELRAAHNYDARPLFERFKIWDVEHEEKKIDLAKKCITQARVFLQDLWIEREAMINKNKALMGITSPALIASDIPEGILIEGI